MRTCIPSELESLYLWCQQKGYPFRVEFERAVVLIDAPRYGFAVTKRELAQARDSVLTLLDRLDESARGRAGL